MPATLAKRPANNGEFTAPPLRKGEVRRIENEAEALSVVRKVAALLADGADRRDRKRQLPYEELDILSDEGLLAITVPEAYGGTGAKSGTLAEVIATLASADGSIGEIPQNHFFMVHALGLLGSEEQKRFFFSRLLAGERFGNALSERGTKTAQDHATRFRQDGAGLRVTGRKFYSTGALFAHWIAVVGNNDDGKSTVAFLPHDIEGVTIIDDWSGFGQRTTGSGSAIFDNVAVHPFQTLPLHALFENPTSLGPHAQIMHAAIDQGIARGALAAAVRFVRSHTRPWKESGVDHGYEDPHIIAEIGELKIRVDAADALLSRAAVFVDAAAETPTADTVAAASIAVAEAKVASTEASLLAGSKLIELGGSSATLAEHNLDRYWRDARTHTVHDPVRWKYRVIGNYWLNGVNPPRHGAL